jgi:hypothetical protein
MKRSRLRHVAACVRTVRRFVDVDNKRCRKRSNCDEIVSKGNVTAMSMQRRYRHHIFRDDDVRDESDLEMTSLYADTIEDSSFRNVRLIPLDGDDIRLVSGARESFPPESDCSSGSSLSLDWLCDDVIDREQFSTNGEVEVRIDNFISSFDRRIVRRKFALEQIIYRHASFFFAVQKWPYKRAGKHLACNM